MERIILKKIITDCDYEPYVVEIEKMYKDIAKYIGNEVILILKRGYFINFNKFKITIKESPYGIGKEVIMEVLYDLYNL